MAKFKCKTFDPQKHRGSDFRHAQLKRDGIWLEVGRAPPTEDYPRGMCFAVTSLPSFVTGAVGRVLPSLWDGLPAGRSVYGELYCPGQPASMVKSKLAKGEESSLSFDAFAFDGDPDYDLATVKHILYDWGFSFAPFFTVSPDTLPSLLRDASPESFYKWWRVHCGIMDCEGVVFKRGNRSDWHKWKPVKTVDLVVVDFKDGGGKNLGLVGSLIGAVYRPDGKTVTVANVGTGISDELRTEISLRRQSYIGKVIEVEYQYVGSGGRLRHPRFKRFRDDKLPAECTTDQDPELEDT